MGSIKNSCRGKYKTHILSWKGDVYCHHCNKRYKRKPILEQHIKTIHLNYRISCPVCPKTYISKSIWHRHMRSIHKIKGFLQSEVTFEPLQTHSKTKSDVSSPYLEMSFETNKAFPSFSNVLMVYENESFGKHVVSKCDIDVRKVVIVSNAFASIECLSSVDSRCFECGKTHNEKFLKCPSCINVFFCSKRCSLSEVHSSKCSQMFIYSDCYIIRLTTEIIRIAFDQAKDTEAMIDFARGVMFSNTKYQKCKLPYSTYGEILNLKGKYENDHSKMAHRVVDCLLSVPGIRFPANKDLKRVLYFLASRHIATIKINSFSEEFPTNNGICIRYSIHDVLSRVNHSCVPNVFHFYDSENIIRGVAVRPIEKGDQIYINYLGEMKFDEVICRQTYIKKHWFFECNCDLCHHSIHSSQPDPSYDYIKANHLKFRNSNCLVEQCLKYLTKHGHLWTNAVDFVINCFICIINDSL